MSKKQKNDLINTFESADNIGVLDYVTAWYVKAAKYIQNTRIIVGFVSTNSIVQGEQTSILWGLMFNKYNIIIHFAHRTFKWNNEARGNAAVYCVIIGFANYDTNVKSIFEYKDIKSEAHEIKVKNINPYLVDAKDIFIGKESNPICNVPKMYLGNVPRDEGHYLFTKSEMFSFILLEPKSKIYFKKLISAREFINNEERYCLWLKEASPNDLKHLNEISKRIQLVKEFRGKSTRDGTRKFANYPTLWSEDRQPESDYILIPLHSSENRKYIPIGFFTKDDIVSNSCSFLPNATLFHFGILTSEMHMAWVRTVCGRIKSDFRYSNTIVYNNYPWPENPSDKQKEAIEKAAQKVLDTRKEFPNSSLADLYDPLTMPPSLVKAHQELDKAVDLAYRPQPFPSEAKRMEFLFELYEKYTANLFTKEKIKAPRKRTGKAKE